MELIVSLVLLPCLAALLLLAVRHDEARDAIAIGFSVLIAVLSVAFAVLYAGGTHVFDLPEAWAGALSYLNLAIELAVGGFVVAYALRYRRWLPFVLAAFQIVVALWFEFAVLSGHEFSTRLSVDTLSVVMVLIIGVVGSGICVYALGYMKDFQAHEPEGARDRRPWFFALMFAFLSAMYNIVLCDNLTWVYTAWEVTTLCSFLLIGFTKTEEAINNAFRQIVMNLLGGIAFQLALVYLGVCGLPLTFSGFLALGAALPATVLLPVTLLAFAGMTKAAQMPFHTWLLGAMVAPTPTSALLHSSTMVKAGVFLLVKLAPIFAVSLVPSVMTVLVGGITFMLCSFMAISQSNAKRVLAYSTIANLGLIVACAGVGTPEAVWAAVFLIVFHAVAKSLLFLCVGTAEHHIGSRDIESMDLLFERMPRLARFMMLGIMGMFIAPFGMLIAKWGTLVSFMTTGNVALIVLLSFGSAATFLFWGKWLGKLSGIAGERPNVEVTVHRTEWAALLVMAILVAVACVTLPALSAWLVEPYVRLVFGVGGQSISDGNLALASIFAVLVILMLFVGVGRGKAKRAEVYLAGVGRNNAERTFQGSFSQPVEATARNWYLEGIFGEARIAPVGTAVCTLIMVVAIAWAAVALSGLL